MWSKPSKKLTINSLDVHLWRKSLNVSNHQIPSLFNVLNEEEKNRAKRFVFEQHQKRFIVARSSLKIILSHYLDIEPHQIQFAYNCRGKPELIEAINPNQLTFNLSHSQDLAIYGITRNHLIGVDVEYCRTIPDAEQLAKRFFCPSEFAKIQSLDAAEKGRTFLKLWTAKEAYLKAIGEGISGGLDQVELSPDEPLRLIKVPHHDEMAWQLLSFVPQSNYLAAMVVQGNQYQINYWQG